MDDVSPRKWNATLNRGADEFLINVWSLIDFVELLCIILFTGDPWHATICWSDESFEVDFAHPKCYELPGVLCLKGQFIK